jgi:carboxyl-terminal processing protease
VVDGERLHLQGSATVPGGAARPRLRDVFVFVNEQKVYFQAAPEAAERLDFAADVPLKPGNNVVTVFAREDDEFQSHRSFVAYRRVAEVASQGPR